MTTTKPDPFARLKVRVAQLEKLRGPYNEAKSLFYKLESERDRSLTLPKDRGPFAERLAYDTARGLLKPSEIEEARALNVKVEEAAARRDELKAQIDPLETELTSLFHEARGQLQSLLADVERRMIANATRALTPFCRDEEDAKGISRSLYAVQALPLVMTGILSSPNIEGRAARVVQNYETYAKRA